MDHARDGQEIQHRPLCEVRDTQPTKCTTTLADRSHVLFSRDLNDYVSSGVASSAKTNVMCAANSELDLWLQMSLFLVAEVFNADSKWKPYLERCALCAPSRHHCSLLLVLPETVF